MVEPTPASLIELARAIVPADAPASVIRKWIREAKMVAEAAGLPPTADVLADQLRKIVPAQHAASAPVPSADATLPAVFAVASDLWRAVCECGQESARHTAADAWTWLVDHCCYLEFPGGETRQ
jgi:hypothetical protein